jgi:hypothetical protein
MNEIVLNSNTCNGLLSTMESERAVPCPDIACWVSAARPSGGKTSAASLRARVQALQPREGLKDDLCICLHFLMFQMLEF